MFYISNIFFIIILFNIKSVKYRVPYIYITCALLIKFNIMSTYARQIIINAQ